MTLGLGEPPQALWWQPVLANRVYDHLRSALPGEGVGLLATVAAGKGRRVVGFYPGINTDSGITRFTMDPVGVLAAFDHMERRGWSFGATVHSHPTSSATPSVTDLREAFYPDALLVIVSLSGPTPEARAWWIAAESPLEVPIRWVTGQDV